jgi:hypothetical protein
MFSDNYAQIHKRNKVLGLLIMLPLFALMGWGIKECSKQPGSYEIQVGQRIIYQMAGSQTLDKAGFYETYSDARPSDFVSFLQSRSGQKLWPPSKQDQTSSNEPSYRLESSNRILKPENLSFAAGERTSWDQPQVVYAADDANNKLLVRGYDPGKDEPMYVYDFDFPTDAGEIPLD